MGTPAWEQHRRRFRQMPSEQANRHPVAAGMHAHVDAAREGTLKALAQAQQLGQLLGGSAHLGQLLRDQPLLVLEPAHQLQRREKSQDAGEDA